MKPKNRLKSSRKDKKKYRIYRLFNSHMYVVKLDERSQDGCQVAKKIHRKINCDYCFLNFKNFV